MTRPGSAPPAAPRTASLARVAGIDAAVVAFGVSAAIVSFTIGRDAPRWHNLVFAPLVFVLAAITLRLVVAEVRALRPVLPATPHQPEAVGALVVAIVMSVVVAPMLLIMPFIFFAAL